MNTIFNFRARQLVPLSVLSLVILSQSAYASMIDDFSTDQGASCASSETSRLCVSGSNDEDSPHQLFSYVNGNMLTGERDIYIKSNTANSSDSGVRVVDGTFDWTNSSKAASTVVIQWDGNDGAKSATNNNEAISEFDSESPENDFSQLMADGQTDDYTFGGKSNGLVFDVSNNDTGFNYELLLTDINGNTATLGGESTGTEDLVTFHFHDFLISGDELAPDFDFTKVDNFQLTLNSQQLGNSVNFNIGYIAAAIPEPSHIALFATCLLGVSSMSRRKKGLFKK